MSSFIALITISSSTVQISSEFYLIEWGARSILYLVIIFPIIYVINYLTSNNFFYHPAIFVHILFLNFLLILNASPLFYILALVLGIIHYFKLRGEREKEIEGKKDNQVKLTNEFSYFEEFIKDKKFDKKREVKSELINEFINSNEAKAVSSLNNKIDILETEIEELEKVNEKKLKIKELEKKLKDLKNSD